MKIPDCFPTALRVAVPADLSVEAAALIAARELAPFLRALAARAEQMVGEKCLDAACSLVGAVLVPVLVGYDAYGTLARKVRGGVDTKRRKKAAARARELAVLLDQVAREPLPPGVAICVGDLLLQALIPGNTPSRLLTERPATLLRRLADGLETEPDFQAALGFASQKPSWRGFVREVKANLSNLGVTLRERDAVALARTLCRAAGAPQPSGDAVRDALRPR